MTTTVSGSAEAQRRRSTGTFPGSWDLGIGANGRNLGYLPIEHYGLIGNMRTCALVGIDGSLDFMCWSVVL